MSKTLRVPDDVHRETQYFARLFNTTPGELIQDAWREYQKSVAFKREFSLAQEAFAKGDPEAITRHLLQEADDLAGERARAARRPED
jgi:hypothetical protein